MNVELTPGQRPLIKQAIENGRITREEQAIEEAMALWEYRERRRLEMIRVPGMPCLRGRRVPKSPVCGTPVRAV